MLPSLWDFPFLKPFKTHLDSALHNLPSLTLLWAGGLDSSVARHCYNLNHCVILWFYTKAFLADTLWLHAHAFDCRSGRYLWLQPKSADPRSLEHSCDPGTGGWHSWNSCSAQQLQVWDSAAKARLRQRSTYTVRGTFMTHHCCWGQNVQSALAMEQTLLWVPETGMRKQSWFKDIGQVSARPDSRLEKT